MAIKRRKQRGASQKAKVAQPPGTLVYVGEAPEQPLRLQLMSFGDDIGQCLLNPPEERIKAALGGREACWLQVRGVHDVKGIARLGEIFNLHSLVLEDILDTTHRPKAESYDGYLYITLKLPRVDLVSHEHWLEQISLVLGANYVISFEDGNSGLLENIKKRLPGAAWRRHGHPAGYLLYAIVDAVVDNYYPYCESLQDEYEDLEAAVLRDPSQTVLSGIMNLRREIIALRKALWPMHDIIAQLERQENRLMPENINLYLRDINDHVMQLLETTESVRDATAAALDIYLSSTNNRINEVMKVLTIFASLFMPLTFLTSLYGMNFDFMPELRLWWAYPALLFVMLCLIVVMVVFFRRRKWL